MSGFYELTPAEQGERVAALARAALASWGLEARELTLLKYRENAVFRVAASDGRRYAIRVHRAGYHSDAELRSELQWMQALSSEGFDVPELVPTHGGKLFDVVSHPDVPEPRQVDLFDWIDGRALGSVEGGVEGDVETLTRTFHTIGVLAARLHNQSARWRPPPGFTRQAWDVEGLVGEQPLWGRFWELAALSEPERALLIRARDRVRKELSGARALLAQLRSHPRRLRAGEPDGRRVAGAADRFRRRGLRLAPVRDRDHALLPHRPAVLRRGRARDASRVIAPSAS